MLGNTTLFYPANSFEKHIEKIQILAKTIAKNIEKRYILTKTVEKILRKGKYWQNQLKQALW